MEQVPQIVFVFGVQALITYCPRPQTEQDAHSAFDVLEQGVTAYSVGPQTSQTAQATTKQSKSLRID